MSLCPHCGSGSRDKDGFCGGCGAPWPLPVPARPAAAPPSASAPSPLLKMAGLESAVASLEVRPKHLGIAVLAALLFGPLGLAYASRFGAAVVSILAMLLGWRYGSVVALLLMHPLCALWAWWVVRE